MAKDYKIIRVQRRTFLDERSNPVDGYFVEFTLLNTMGSSFVNIPVAIYTKELRDTLIAAEIQRLKELTAP